jgi:hypothetical protein
VNKDDKGAGSTGTGWVSLKLRGKEKKWARRKDRADNESIPSGLTKEGRYLAFSAVGAGLGRT